MIHLSRSPAESARYRDRGINQLQSLCLFESYIEPRNQTPKWYFALLFFRFMEIYWTWSNMEIRFHCAPLSSNWYTSMSYKSGRFKLEILVLVDHVTFPPIYIFNSFLMMMETLKPRRVKRRVHSSFLPVHCVSNFPHAPKRRRLFKSQSEANDRFMGFCLLLSVVFAFRKPLRPEQNNKVVKSRKRRPQAWEEK